MRKTIKSMTASTGTKVIHLITFPFSVCVSMLACCRNFLVAGYIGLTIVAPDTGGITNVTATRGFGVCFGAVNVICRVYRCENVSTYIAYTLPLTIRLVGTGGIMSRLRTVNHYSATLDTTYLPVVGITT